MPQPLHRSALGGVLAGLMMVVGAGGTARAQMPLPAYTPATAGQLPLPPVPPPGVPANPPQPQYQPAQQPQGQPMALPVYEPAVPQNLPPFQAQPPAGQPQPMGGQPMPGQTPMPMGTQPGKDGKTDGKDSPPATTTTGGGQPPGGSPKFDIVWNYGPYIQTANKDFVFHVGGTLHDDQVWYQASPQLTGPPGAPVQGLSIGTNGRTGQFIDGNNVRRARIYFDGTLYKQVDFKFELEFYNGIGVSPVGTTGPTTLTALTNTPGVTDAWIQVKDIPVIGNVRIGNQKEWFSLEHINNYQALEFLERSYLFDVAQLSRFNNGFSPGISMFRTWMDNRLFSGIGLYKNDSTLIGDTIGYGQYAVTGRLAGMPVWMPDDKIFWEVGGAMSHRDPVAGTVSTSVRDDIRNAPLPLLPQLINTGAIAAQSQDLFNLETAAVWGPVTFQAEYLADVLRGATNSPTLPGQNLMFQGYYAEVMYFLTGESRTWNNSLYAFNRPTPLHPLRWVRHTGDGCDCEEPGFGAWEVAFRYQYLDMSNRFIQAGRLNAYTVGLNWYLNANAKLQFNYDYTQRGDTSNPAQGAVHGFGTRVAVFF